MKLPQSLQRYQGAIRSDADDSALVKLGTLKAWVALIIGLLPVPSRGITVRRSSHGDVWTVLDASQPGGTVNADGTVAAFTIGGVMPTIGGDRLDEDYTPLDIGSGTVYVIVTIASTLTKQSGSFVQTITVTSAAISTTDTDPGAAGLSSGSGGFSLVLATFQDGVKTYQGETGDWSVDVVDNRTGAGVATFVRID